MEDKISLNELLSEIFKVEGIKLSIENFPRLSLSEDDEIFDRYPYKRKMSDNKTIDELIAKRVNPIVAKGLGEWIIKNHTGKFCLYHDKIGIVKDFDYTKGIYTIWSQDSNSKKIPFDEVSVLFEE